ncbi:MAG: HAMP domain-containing sensor histidine kinase [Marinicella sp.]|nr:hypothetical protein [Xanthomonadales bacterium]
MIRNDDTEKLFHLEKKNLKYLNLFRLFISVFFVALINSQELVIEFFNYPDQHPMVKTVTELYLAFSVLIMVLSFTAKQDDAIRISKLVLYLDLFILIYLAFATNGFTIGLGMLPILAIGSAAILYRKALFILLAPFTASLLLWFLPAVITFEHQELVTNSTKLLHSLGYFVIALLGIRQSVSYTSTLKMYRSQRKTISGLENMNQIIIENLTNGVIIYQQDNVILHANQSAKNLLDMDDIIFFPPAVQEYIDSDKDGLVYHANNGKNLYLRKASVAGEQNFGVLFIEDSTFLKKAAQQLNLASLGKMSSSIAHEIRNPLAAISTAAELLVDSPELKEQDKQICEIIVNQTRRANHIIEDILEMSRRKTAKPEMLPLFQYLNNAKKQMVEQKLVDENQIQMVVSKNTLINFDPDHLEQVIWNLASNAIKHGNDNELQMTVHGHKLDFKNKGEAFDEGKISNLFEPFFTTHNRGTGLGLHICRQLCHDNHAELNYHHINGYHVFRIEFNLN